MAKLLVIIKHHKHMCYDEIGLSPKRTDTILGSIVKIGRAYVITTTEKKFFHFVLL